MYGLAVAEFPVPSSGVLQNTSGLELKYAAMTGFAQESFHAISGIWEMALSSVPA